MLFRGGRGQKLPILLSKKTTMRGGGGQKLLILRRHSLWTAPLVSLPSAVPSQNTSNPRAELDSSDRKNSNNWLLKDGIVRGIWLPQYLP